MADEAVTGANEVAQATVQEVENAAVASGLVSVVSDATSHDPTPYDHLDILFKNANIQG